MPTVIVNFHDFENNTQWTKFFDYGNNINQSPVIPIERDSISLCFSTCEHENEIVYTMTEWDEMYTEFGFCEDCGCLMSRSCFDYNEIMDQNWVEYVD